MSLTKKCFNNIQLSSATLGVFPQKIIFTKNESEEAAHLVGGDQPDPARLLPDPGVSLRPEPARGHAGETPHLPGGVRRVPGRALSAAAPPPGRELAPPPQPKPELLPAGQRGLHHPGLPPAQRVGAAQGADQADAGRAGGSGDEQPRCSCEVLRSIVHEIVLFIFLASFRCDWADGEQPGQLQLLVREAPVRPDGGSFRK